MALDFPSSPTNGQTYGNYYYDATIGAWNSFSSIGNVIPSTLKNLSVTTDDVGLVPFTVNGISGQTVNLQNWKNSAGTVVASVNNAGVISADTLNLVNDLTVTNGGTGAGTFTTGAYLKGNGTSAIQAQTGIPFADVTMIEIPAAADLNTYTTQGLYHQSQNTEAAGGTNYPVAYAGLLEVLQSGVDGSGFTYQRYTVYQAQFAVYVRSKWTTTWSAWKLIAFNDSPTFTGTVTAPVLASTVATGTAPLTVASTTLVSNLNADLLDGQHLSTGGTVNTVVSRDANGRSYINGLAVNSSLTDLTNNSPWYGIGQSNLIFPDATTGQNATQLAGHFGINIKTSQNELRVGYLNNNNGLLFNGNRVSHAGNINLAPLQPAFFVGRSGSTTVNNTILFDLIKTNIGSYYNSSNGRFTAPVAGTYYFNAGTIGTTSGTTRINIRINNANFWGNFHIRSINTANYGDASVSFCFTLAAGDYVTLFVGENVAYDDGTGYTHFSGHLVG